jgi:hypothetical protein
MGRTGEVAVYGDARAAARLFDGTAKIVEGEPNRVFADDEVRVSGRRLVRLILLRLDGEVPDDDDD